MGTQSRGLLGGFLSRETRVLAVCDLDTSRAGAIPGRVLGNVKTGVKCRIHCCPAALDLMFTVHAVVKTTVVESLSPRKAPALRGLALRALGGRQMSHGRDRNEVGF